jgi:hypothetical protein
MVTEVYLGTYNRTGTAMGFMDSLSSLCNSLIKWVILLCSWRWATVLRLAVLVSGSADSELSTTGPQSPGSAYSVYCLPEVSEDATHT